MTERQTGPSDPDSMSPADAALMRALGRILPTEAPAAIVQRGKDVFLIGVASRGAQVDASLSATGLEEVALSASAADATIRRRALGSGSIQATELTPGQPTRVLPQIRGH